MKIISIHIYPIKSLGGISLQSAKVLERGLEFDRRWMLVDNQGVFLTQRQHPKLTLFSVSMDNTNLLVHSGLDASSIYIPLVPDGDELSVQVWDDKLKAVEVNKEVSQWFSTQLGQSVRLVCMPQDSKRLIDTRYASNAETVSFADGYPLLLVNHASFNELNDKLTKKIEIGRFRPNVIINGAKSYEEDDWGSMKLGSARIEVVKKCARCVMVNINPSTAAKETEVLQVLSTYRKEGAKVLFGVNALIHKEGDIKVGDELFFVG